MPKEKQESKDSLDEIILAVESVKDEEDRGISNREGSIVEIVGKEVSKETPTKQENYADLKSSYSQEAQGLLYSYSGSKSMQETDSKLIKGNISVAKLQFNESDYSDSNKNNNQIEKRVAWDAYREVKARKKLFDRITKKNYWYLRIGCIDGEEEYHNLL